MQVIPKIKLHWTKKIEHNVVTLRGIQMHPEAFTSRREDFGDTFLVIFDTVNV